MNHTHVCGLLINCRIIWKNKSFRFLGRSDSPILWALQLSTRRTAFTTDLILLMPWARRLDLSTTWIRIGRTKCSSGGCTVRVAPSNKSTLEPLTFQRPRADTSFQPWMNTPSVSVLSCTSSTCSHGYSSFLPCWCTGCLEASSRKELSGLRYTRTTDRWLCIQGDFGTPHTMVPRERLLLLVSSHLLFRAASHQQGCSVWECY